MVDIKAKLTALIMFSIFLVTTCSCININNVPGQESIIGKWYSTHVNMNGQWSSAYVYDNGTGNPDKILVFVKIEHPVPSNVEPFFLSSWCYEFQSDGYVTIDDGQSKDNMGRYSYNNGTLLWGGVPDEVVVTKDLLIFQRDNDYWILKRQGQLAHIPLTYEQGIGLWKKNMAEIKYDKHFSNQVIMPIETMNGVETIFNW
jgi:hypothetical protein